MEKLQFANWMQALYANFGKAAPSNAVLLAVYRRIESLPDGFLAFAAEKLEDYTTLPVNLGRELRRILWPEYLGRHPELRARDEERCCRNCSPDVPGFFWAYEPNGKRILCKCVCNTAAFEFMPAMTHAHACELGLSLTDPTRVATPANPAFRRPPPVGQIHDSRAEERMRHLPDAERDDYGHAGAWS